MSGGIYDCYSWVKMLLGSGEWVEPGMLLITPQCPQWPHREPPGPEFSSVQGGPCPQPEEPWLGSQTTPLPRPDSPGPLMLHPALRLRCHSSVSTATLPSRTHSAPQNSGHEAAHAAFPLLGPSPRMRQKTSFVFFAPKVVPLRVFLSQAGYPKMFQAFMPPSLSLSHPKSKINQRTVPTWRPKGI